MTLSYEEAKARKREANQKSMQTTYRARRDAAHEAYGGRCRVCDNPDRTKLIIVPRRGYQWSHGHTETPIRGGHEKMRWLDRNGYPDTHTLVCGPTYSECRRRLQYLVD